MTMLSRRTFLRGAGVSIALPWLESLRVWGQDSAKAEPPVRLAVVFADNGFHGREWYARGEGKSLELGKVLEPLAPVKEKLIFFRGLYNQQSGKGGIHSAQTGDLLTGAVLEGGGGIRSGISMDQLAAQRTGRDTKVPSLVLGCEASMSALHKGYSMIYSSHISWSSPTTPTPLELYPALAFDRLFRDEAGKGDASVLDQVIEEAKGLGRKISYGDRAKIDEYLNSVREVEQGIQQAAQKGRPEGWKPTLEQPDQPRPADGLPQDVDVHMKLMCDLLVLAFQTDTTRISTLKLNNDHSSMRFPHLGVDYMIHHLLSHNDNADWLKVNRFFTEQVAYIAGKLDRIQEGERTALDNTMILYLSSMLEVAAGSRRAARSTISESPIARCAACTCRCSTRWACIWTDSATRRSGWPRSRVRRASGLLLVLGSILGAAPQERQGLEIVWVDVEGGAATLIATPAGETILVDSGWPEDRDAERIRRSLVEILGAKRIDHYLTTHWHLDHWGAIGRVAGMLPVEKYYGHAFPGTPQDDIVPEMKDAWMRLSEGKRVWVKPGDTLPLRSGVEVKFLTSNGDVIGETPGTAQIRDCAFHPAAELDPGENARSVGFLLSFGGFRFLDLGDLTWNVEHRLVCPRNLIGPVDVYQVTHHGWDPSNNPALVRAIAPTVAIINNGAKKGGTPKVFQTLRSTPGIRDIWQLHRNVETAAIDNAAPELTANDLEACRGEILRLSVAPDGKSYTVSIPSKGTARTYASH
jgi:beta-lactamase superfamily II metal-dependent hydrolase